MTDKYRVEFIIACGGFESAGVIIEIAGERKRQVEDKGNTTAHDDQRNAGELAAAAACYALHSIDDPRPVYCGKPCRGLAKGGDLWPFDPSWWKPGEPRRDLIKAAALIVAEIERLDRAVSLGEKMADEYIEAETEHMKDRESEGPDPLPVPHRER